MNAAFRIAREEWRLWARSRVVLIAALTIAVLVTVTSVLTALRVTDEAAARSARQASAEAAFFSQPDRHPHRMVHYGHYAFRTPPPLAAFDPGVDAVTGQSIFLEGHRQNTAMFADARSLLLLPVGALAIHAVVGGEAPLAAGLLVAGYALYLAVWAALVLAVSLWVRQRNVALGVLVLVWVMAALVVPRIAINAGSAAIDAPGKIASDLAMLAEQRKLGDGHNAADPAFDALQRQVLEQYGVQSVEQLPINWRGVVAGYSEKKLTGLMNDFTENRMAREAAQSRIVTGFGILSPTLAAGAASRALAGTDLATHHRFLRESETLRFDFVQALNDLHTNALSFADDAKRSSDPEAEARTRVNADAWRLLDTFRFAPDPAEARAARAALPLAMLACWLALLFGAILIGARRLRP